jgi:hypothetical protein
MARMRFPAFRLGLLAWLAASAAYAGSGYDAASAPSALVSRLGLDREEPAPAIGTWLRVRGFPNAPLRSPDAPEREEAIQEVRAALGRLREAGYRSVCFMRWSGSAWESGVRQARGAGNRAPLDLREAFERARAFAETYGDLVDAWEFENEPDIGFFADNADVMAAYYKALALGIAAGRGARPAAGPTGDGEARSTVGPTGASDVDPTGGRVVRRPIRSLIVMPAMCLPPGPYLEQLMRNGILGYTEGVNLHYYGFAEDYGSAHDRLREALEAGGREAGAGRGRPGARRWGPRHRPAGAEQLAPPVRRFPVFVTEWGYARLDGVDAQTVEGRVRQWRFFRDVQRENRRREVAAPMAFYLASYFEAGAKEFGLLMPFADRRATHYGFEVQDVAEVDSAESDLFRAGGLVFAPADFGAEATESWMRRIGEQIGRAEASPALAWLMEEAARPHARGARGVGGTGNRAGHFRSPSAGHPPPAWLGEWRLRAEAPSPVVLDFVAGEGTMAVKNFHGYLLSGPGAEAGTRGGAGKLVLYHFGTESAEVTLAWSEHVRPAEEASGGAPASSRFVLKPGERREVDVRLVVKEEHFAAVDAALAAEVRSGGARTVSRWATRLYPSPDRHQPVEGRTFFFPAERAAGNRRWLETRPLATEELSLQQQGGGSRWRTTPGVTVEETESGWRFHVEALPGAYLSPAVAELPLPDDWAPWERGLLLRYDYRIAPASYASRRPLGAEEADATRRLQTGRLGDMIESYLRTRTGAMYATVPRLRPTLAWKRYNQPAETLTPHFPGRQAAPLRVEKERPAALVFYFRPTGLPTTFEIERPALAHWRIPPDGKAKDGAR